MTKMNITLLTLAAVLVLSSLLLAGPPENSGDESATVQDTGELNLEGTIALLQTEYNLWLDAVLSGSREESEDLEKNLLGIINLDITINQEKVRSMAKEVALASGNLDVSESGVSEADSNRLKQEISHLNAKESVFRSAVKTKAFSNKYRLLGDYIDLLRRELKMPRLKLASNDKLSESTEDRSGAVPVSNK